MKRGYVRNKNGITLIGLIVTLIVLIILAGVAVSSLTQNDNMIKRAGQASNSTKNAIERENDVYSVYTDYLKKASGEQE